MQRDTQRCSDACADRNRQAEFVSPISHGFVVTHVYVLAWRIAKINSAKEVLVQSSRIRTLMEIIEPPS